MAASVLQPPAAPQEQPPAAEEADHDEDDGNETQRQPRGPACSDVTLMHTEFAPFFVKSDWLVYKNDLSKHPAVDDKKQIMAHLQLAICIKERVVPNCALAKKATEHAIELIVNDKDWDITGAAMETYCTEQAKILRTFAKHVGSLYNRAKRPKWFTDAIKAFGDRQLEAVSICCVGKSLAIGCAMRNR